MHSCAVDRSCRLCGVNIQCIVFRILYSAVFVILLSWLVLFAAGEGRTSMQDRSKAIGPRSSSTGKAASLSQLPIGNKAVVPMSSACLPPSGQPMLSRAAVSRLVPINGRSSVFLSIRFARLHLHQFVQPSQFSRSPSAVFMSQQNLPR